MNTRTKTRVIVQATPAASPILEKPRLTCDFRWALERYIVGDLRSRHALRPQFSSQIEMEFRRFVGVHESSCAECKRYIDQLRQLEAEQNGLHEAAERYF